MAASAMIDNEPENLNAIATSDVAEDALLLHADTIFESRRDRIPACSVSGNVYDITALINRQSLPSHIQLVWCRLDTSALGNQRLPAR